MSSTANAIARRIVANRTIGPVLARGATKAGAVQLGRRIALVAGEPLPEVASVGLSSGMFSSKSLGMQTLGGREQIARSVWSRGWRSWETPLPEMVAAVTSPEATVLDIGANTGFYSLLAASVSPGVRVHAFEPLPAVAEILTGNLKLNPQGSQVTVVPDAVDSEPGQTELYVPLDGHGLVETSASLEESFRTEWSNRITVNRQTVDGYCRNLERVDVLKIDAECRERQVLDGARETLARTRAIVFLEVMDCDEWQSDVDALQAIAHDLDYASVRLHADGATVAEVVGYDEPWRNQALWPRERLAELEAVSRRLRSR
jgi:FkbM family methyltransferase